METFKFCRFCEIVSGRYLYQEIDEPFASDENFIAVASIGALVEGWSLVIPKSHQLSMRNIYGSSSLDEFMGLILPPLIAQYGPLISFEHGANKEGSITACGTDHAHLHLVPFKESLLPDLKKSGLRWFECRTSEVNCRSGISEYLFYCELSTKRDWKDPIGYLHVLEHPLSQFFRHLIAGRKGKAYFFDYHRFPHLNTARQTRNVMVGSFNYGSVKS